MRCVMLAEFMSAVCRGQHERVRVLLRDAPHLASQCDPSCFGATALMHAAGADDREMVDVLLDGGADVNQRSDWWAGSFGVLDDCSDEMGDYLLSRGAMLTPHAAARLGRLDELREMLDREPALVRARGGDGQLPLHFARTPEVAELLLSRGAELEARDVDHESTAAQWLARSRPATAAYLVARGCQADGFLAAMVGDEPLLRGFVQADPAGPGARIARERFPTTPRAAGHIYLFTIGEGCALMHAAAICDQPGSVRVLAEAGADVNVRGGYDDATPLHQAAWADSPQAAAALIDAGAEIDAPSGRLHDNEPIGWAIVSGAARTVRVLLQRGATLRKAHLSDAAAGVRGQFRGLNRRRPPSAWAEVAQIVADHVQRGAPGGAG